MAREGSKALLSTTGPKAGLHLALACGAPPSLLEAVTAPSCHLPTLSTSRFWSLWNLIPAVPSEIYLPDIVGVGHICLWSLGLTRLQRVEHCWVFWDPVSCTLDPGSALPREQLKPKQGMVRTSQ